MKNDEIKNGNLAQGQEQVLLDQIRHFSDAFEAKLTQLSILKELGTALLYINDFRRVCKTILKVAVDNTIARNCSIMLVDQARDCLFLVAATSPDGKTYLLDTNNIFSKEGVQYTFSAGEGVAGEALRKKTSVLVEDVNRSEVFVWMDDTRVKIGTVMSSPLIVEDNALGVLTLSHPDKHAFESETVNLFNIMASFVALAINSTLNYQRLRYSEGQYRALAEHARYGISIIQDDNHQYVNPSYERLSGYSLNELEEMPFSQIISRSSASQGLCGIGAPGFYEAVMTTKKGEHIDIEISHAPFVYQGRPAEIVSVMDLSEHRKLEARLRQAQKMEAIGTLAGGIAHDFNNILAAMMGYAELAQLDCPRGSPIASNLGHVLKAGNRAKDLVGQVLTFSRRKEPKQEPLRASPVIKEALRLLRATIPSTIEIRQDIASSTGVIMADPTHIHQILMNLCTNSAYAMQEEGGTLEITLQDVDLDEAAVFKYPTLQPGAYVRLSVMDTGQGMDGNTVKRIFDPFFTTKDPGVGTGMGLAVVHGIVKSHGGQIIVESKPGEGSRFHVYLPRIEAPTIPHRTEDQPLTKGTERILFVDDEKTLVQMGTQMLEYLGYRVTARTDPIEALEAFRRRPDRFDLVITDQTMPHMTGEHLAAELMRLRPDVPIILCSGYSELMTERKARALGIRQYIAKPLVMRYLANSVRKALDSR